MESWHPLQFFGEKIPKGQILAKLEFDPGRRRIYQQKFIYLKKFESVSTSLL